MSALWVSDVGACILGSVAGALVILGMELLEHLRIDDPVGAWPVHVWLRFRAGASSAVAPGRDCGKEIAMAVPELRAQLEAIPEPAVQSGDAVLRGIDESVAYLDSEAALASIAIDPYVPKWDAPWWRALLLFELGEAARIPTRLLAVLSARLNALPLHSFPIQPSDIPPGMDPDCFIPCHCAVGSIAQVHLGST